MQNIPIQPVPAQSFTIVLDGQVCQINIYQKTFGLFVDLYVNNFPIVVGAIAENIVRMVRSLYLGFAGDIAFIDIQGTSDPTFDGLGSRYFLIYLEVSDLPPGVG